MRWNVYCSPYTLECIEEGVMSYPGDWKTSTVGAEFDIQLGKMLDRAKNSGVPKPYLGNRAVQWGNISVDNLDMMEMSSEDMRRFRLQRGDLLVCEGGEVGRAAIWEAPLGECYYQKALHRLRPRRGYDPRLMLEYLRFWVDRGDLSNYVTQTSIAHLTKEKLATVPLPVPPSDEQRAIAAALSEVDDLLAALAALIEKKRAVKTAAMQRLLTGRQRLPGVSGEWATKRLGDVFQFLGTANNSRADLGDDGDVGYIHYGDIHKGTVSHLDCAQVDLPRIDLDKVRGAALIQEGDLVMADASEDYDGIGKSVEITNLDGQRVVAGLHTFLLRGDRGALADGFKGYLQFVPALRNALVRMATGISVYGISKGKVREIEIELPPVPEQAAIAEILSDMDAEIAALEARREKTRMIKQGMMQELLTGRTRLVPSH